VREFFGRQTQEYASEQKIVRCRGLKPYLWRSKGVDQALDEREWQSSLLAAALPA
jgi:hypothetical protein